MDTVIIAAAQYLIYAMVLGFAAVWLWGERGSNKIRLALAAVIGLIAVLIMIKICSAAYVNPRPFVVDPSLTPLIEHAPDNGFPSDHSAAAGLMAVLIVIRHRIVGIAFVLAAVCVATGRVAAHVHHLLDVGVGLGIGALAAVIGIVCMTIIVRTTPVLTWWPARWGGGDSGPTAGDRSATSSAPDADDPPIGRHRSP